MSCVQQMGTRTRVRVEARHAPTGVEMQRDLGFSPSQPPFSKQALFQWKPTPVAKIPRPSMFPGQVCILCDFPVGVNLYEHLVSQRQAGQPDTDPREKAKAASEELCLHALQHPRSEQADC